MGEKEDRAKLLKENQELRQEILLLKRINENYRKVLESNISCIAIWKFIEPMPQSFSVNEAIMWAKKYLILSDCNAAHLQAYGYGNKHQVVGKSFFELMQSNDEMYDEIIRNFHKIGFEAKNEISEEIDAKGNQIWLLNNTTAIVNNGFLYEVHGSAINITSKIVAEKKLAESEDLHKSLAISNKMVAWELDLKTNKFTYVSPVFEELFGYEASWLTDFEKWVSFVDPDDREYAASFCQIETQHGRDHGFEYRVIDSSGDIRWVKDFVNIVRENGEIIKLRGFFVDNTEIKEKELKIIESEGRFRTLITSSPIAIALSDIDNNVVLLNKKFTDIFGYDIADIKHLDDWWIRAYPNTDYRSKIKSDWMNLVSVSIQRQEALEAFESIVTCKDNTKKLIEFNYSVVGDYGITTFNDITLKRKTESDVRKLSKAIQQSPISVILTNKEGSIEYVNPFFTKTSGYSLKEVLGKTPAILKSGKHKPGFYSKIWKTINAGEVWEGDIINKNKNGELFWESISISPVFDINKEITHFVALKQDITSRKNMENDLIVAKEKAEESDQLKSAFLANMSHEIRTPLNSILGFSELLNDDELEVGQRSFYTDTILRNGNQLLSIVNDILDISKIETNQIHVSKSHFVLDELIHEVIINHTPQAEEKPIALLFTKNNADEELTIYSDVYLLNRVLNNLVSNAVKFTEKGYAKVSYSVKENNLEVTVTDTGIGIAAEMHSAIFDRFRQAEAETTRKYGGTGLGLAITQKIVNLLGGEIWVESAMNKGTSFHFTLPITEE